MALIKRVLAIGALGFLFVTAVAQEEPATISYTSFAKTADMIVAELAEQTGLRLETKDDAKNHVLVIHVTDISVDDLLDRIASATSSRWSKVGDRRTLIVDATLRKRERAAIVAENAKEISSGIEKLRKKLEEEPEDSPFAGAMFGSALGSPADRALAQLAQMLNAKDIAQLAEDGRIVYSTNANKMQRSMSGGRVGNILNTLFNEHNVYVDKAIKDRQEMMAGMGDENSAMMGIMEMFMGQTEPRRFESAPSKALLVVETGGMFSFMSDGLQLKLKVYDQEGNTIVTGDVPLSTNNMFIDALENMSEEDAPEDEAVVEVDETDLVKIKFSDKSKLYSELNMMSTTGTSSMSPELVDFLLDPVTHDPLSFTNSDSLISIAKAKGLNLIANLPDGDMMNMFRNIGEGQSSTVGQAMAMFEGSEGLELSTENGWLIISPADKISARDTRQSRVALRALVNIAHRDGTVDLDSIAAFALRSPKPSDNAMSTRYLGVFAPTMLQGLMGDTMDWDMLRFYGSLPSATKMSLRNGEQIPFSAIGGKARGFLTKMAFGSNANILPAAALKSSASEPQFMQMMKMMMPGSDSSYTEEPTEVMPNGLPNNGFLALDVTNLPIVQGSVGGGMAGFGMGALGPEEVALIEFFQEAAGPEMGDVTQELGDLKMGSRESYRFTFWLSPDAGLSKTLHDDSVSKDGKPVTLSNLPPAFRALVAKAKEQIKSSPLAQIAAMMGDFGQQQVDPPQ